MKYKSGDQDSDFFNYRVKENKLLSLKLKSKQRSFGLNSRKITQNIDNINYLIRYVANFGHSKCIIMKMA